MSPGGSVVVVAIAPLLAVDLAYEKTLTPPSILARHLQSRVASQYCWQRLAQVATKQNGLRTFLGRRPKTMSPHVLFRFRILSENW